MANRFDMVIRFLSTLAIPLIFFISFSQLVIGDPETEGVLEEVEVYITGSRIKGASESGLIRASILNSEELEVFAADSAGDLLGNLAQAGAFEFTEAADGPNDARGDIATVNLRGLGSGNTLVMLNGRRMVLHPFTQDVDRTPRAIVNVNTIPAQAISRTEILKDGASALYGTDATAGVVNAIIKDDYEGQRISIVSRSADNVNLKTRSLYYSNGFSFNDGSSHISIFGSFYEKNGIFASELPYAQSVDKRPLIPSDWISFNTSGCVDGEKDCDFRNLDRISPWGQFIVGSANLNGDWEYSEMSSVLNSFSSDVGGPPLVSGASGTFHIQPSYIGNESGIINNDIHIGTGMLDRDLRWNTNLRRQLSPAITRQNLFLNLNHDFDNGITFFGELVYYSSKSQSQRATQPIDRGLAYQVIPKQNYWNPFGGPEALNRVEVLVSDDGDGAETIDPFPEEDWIGSDILIDRWRPYDIGPRTIQTDAETYRILGGLEWYWGNWDMESAFFYNYAEASDSSGNLIDKTLLNDALALTTPLAVNPFGGPGSNTDEQMDQIRTSITNRADTELLSFDLRGSLSDLFILPYTQYPAGIATGFEWRFESYTDDRDKLIDGSIPYMLGLEKDINNNPTGSDLSNVAGISPTADSRGQRNVLSTYGEILIPLISDIRFIERLDFQYALRYEYFDDTKEDVLKPKYALAWHLNDILSFRASYAEGFRAPNLVQLYRGDISRLDRDLIDWWRKAVGATDSLENAYRRVVRESNPDLKPEETQSSVFGFQLDIPVFDGEGSLLISVDSWKFEQENVIETLGGAEQLALDYILRQQGSYNPFVIRDWITENDLELYEQNVNYSASDAAGEVLYIRDPYQNLDQRIVEGVDFAMRLTLPEYKYGKFGFQMEASYLDKFDQPNYEVEEIFSDPLITEAIANREGGDLEKFETSRIKLDGKPRLRSSATMNWRKGSWGAAWSYTYVGSFYDTSACHDIRVDGDRCEYWEVEDWLTQNLQIDYRLRLNDLPSRIRFSVSNIEDKDPPLADQARGYYTSFHHNRGRMYSISLRHDLN